jgi:hypothetical protein
MTFTDLMTAANESKTGRNPGQWTPAACKVWREADPEDARLLEAGAGVGVGDRPAGSASR